MKQFKGTYCGNKEHLSGKEALLKECCENPNKLFAKFLSEGILESSMWNYYNKSDFDIPWQEWFGRS